MGRRTDTQQPPEIEPGALIIGVGEEGILDKVQLCQEAMGQIIARYGDHRRDKKQLRPCSKTKRERERETCLLVWPFSSPLLLRHLLPVGKMDTHEAGAWRAGARRCSC
jgi:hypothetical protein